VPSSQMPCIHDLAPKFDVLCVTDVTSRDNKENFYHPKKIDKVVIKEPADSDYSYSPLFIRNSTRRRKTLPDSSKSAA
jgi:hypothetical protein